MEWIAWIICGLASVTMQVTIVAAVFPRTLRPDLVLLFVVVISVYRRGWPPLVIAWLMGLFVDLHSIERSGLTAMTYFLIALLIALVRPFITLSRLPIFVMVAAAASLAAQALGWGYLAWMYPLWSRPEKGPSLLLGPALFTAALAIPFALLLKTFKVREAGRIRLRSRK